MNIRASAFVVLLTLLPAASSYGRSDSLSIYFRTGVAELDDGQTKYLDSVLYDGGISPGTIINITGYADEPGTTALNKSIAVRRAAAVKAYLISSGIESDQIVECAGIGNLVHTGNDQHQRRVDILFGSAGSLTSGRTTRHELNAKPAGLTPGKKSLRDLSTMKPGDLMVIENLQFKLSTAVFEPASLPVLKELADVLRDFPRLTIRLEGHICCGGKEDSSKRLQLGYSLSLSRAQAVLWYLLAHNISSWRLSCTGFGYSRPKIYPERSLEDSYVNRRVEIRVVSNK